jgi:7,8-dihydropterin-6-yl-methyl-4-(beta-D-ribofuranosyl)aminobenzene 5'-phosphate synthase
VADDILVFPDGECRAGKASFQISQIELVAVPRGRAMRHFQMVVLEREESSMNPRAMLAIASGLASLVMLSIPAMTAAAEPKEQITIIYDAFGTDPAMTKDWGFSALIEVAGKRILFDTGDNADIFAANVKAKGIDLRNLDFVVLSHRHSDHMAGLSYVLSVNPKVKIYAPKEGFGIFGSALPSSFYRKDNSLPPEMRYYDGKPPEIMKFGAAWATANFELVDQTTEIAPGITLIALISDAPGTKELKELSLAVNTPDGVVLVVGCSHPGIERIVEAATAINPRIHLVAGGFHLVVASDEVIEKAVTALKDRFKVEYIAPGHCTGEPTFAALKKAFGARYLYAGLGTSLALGPNMGSDTRRGEGYGLDDLATYRKLASREDR